MFNSFRLRYIIKAINSEKIKKEKEKIDARQQAFRSTLCPSKFFKIH